MAKDSKAFLLHSKWEEGLTRFVAWAMEYLQKNNRNLITFRLLKSLEKLSDLIEKKN